MRWIVASMALLAGCGGLADAGAPPVQVDGSTSYPPKVVAWQLADGETVLCSHASPGCGPHQVGDCTFSATTWLSHGSHPGILRDVSGFAYIVIWAGDGQESPGTKNITSTELEKDLPEPRGTWKRDQAQHPSLQFAAPCDANEVTISFNLQADGWRASQTARIVLREP